MDREPGEPTTTRGKALSMGLVGAFLGFFIGAIAGATVITWVAPTPDFPVKEGAISGAVVGGLVAAIIGSWLRSTRFTP